MGAANDRWEFYKDQHGKWRWRRIAANNEIVGASSQGYVRRIDCIENATRNGFADPDETTAEA